METNKTAKTATQILEEHVSKFNSTATDLFKFALRGNEVEMFTHAMTEYAQSQTEALQAELSKERHDGRYSELNNEIEVKDAEIKRLGKDAHESNRLLCKVAELESELVKVKADNEAITTHNADLIASLDRANKLVEERDKEHSRLEEIIHRKVAHYNDLLDKKMEIENDLVKAKEENESLIKGIRLGQHLSEELKWDDENGGSVTPNK